MKKLFFIILLLPFFVHAQFGAHPTYKQDYSHGRELIGLIVDSAAGLPILNADPSEGNIYYNTVTNKFRFLENGVWVEYTSSSSANTFVNGLHATGSAAKLGGGLIEATNILGDGFNISIGTSGNAANILGLYSSHGFSINDSSGSVHLTPISISGSDGVIINNAFEQQFVMASRVFFNAPSFQINSLPQAAVGDTTNFKPAVYNSATKEIRQSNWLGDGNYYPTTVQVDNTNGTVVITRNGISTITSNSFDGRYLRSEVDPVWTAAIPNYYTKTNLQTSGQSAVHFNNITNVPAFVVTETDPTVAARIKAIPAGTNANQYLGWNGTSAYVMRQISYSEISGTPTEIDPVFVASVAHSILSTDITHWNQAYNKYPVSGTFSAGTITYIARDGTTAFTVTGLPTGAGASETDPIWTAAIPNYYTKTNLQTGGQALVHWNNITNAPAFLTSFTETDPVWTAAIPNYYTKTNLQISGQSAVHWNNITNAPAFLTSFTETDPIFNASVAKTITSTNVTNWNQAYNKYPVSGSYSAGTISYFGRDATQVFQVTGLPTATLNQFNVAVGNSLNQVSGSGALQFDGIDFKVNNTAAELWLIATNTNGHTYRVISADANYGVGAGWFSVYDNTASAYRLSISPLGVVRNYNLAGNGSGLVGVNNNGDEIFVATPATLLAAGSQYWIQYKGVGNTLDASQYFSYTPSNNLNVGSAANNANAHLYLAGDLVLQDKTVAGVASKATYQQSIVYSEISGSHSFGNGLTTYATSNDFNDGNVAVAYELFYELEGAGTVRTGSFHFAINGLTPGVAEFGRAIIGGNPTEMANMTLTVSISGGNVSFTILNTSGTITSGTIRYNIRALGGPGN